MSQSSYRHALPTPAHQQPVFIQPPSQQYALAQHPQQLALPQPLQQLALPPPPQQFALPQPNQQQALPPPQKNLAIEYIPRGEKRKNTQIREEDRKRITLENDVKNIQRGIKEDVQMGRGYMKLYNKVKNCDDDENLQKVMLGLSDKHIWRIQNCVFCYLDGSLDIGSEKIEESCG